ncbi:uracil-DNA glycosylase, partial [bacterium]|nr:uracil-DNA glycosylase [bacterium]
MRRLPTASASPTSPQTRETQPDLTSKARPMAAPTLPPSGTKTERLAALRAETLQCQICPHLAKSRTQVVFGVGDPEARLMFVGEAPGADEDEKGEPFVGLAGKLLTKMLTAMELTREQIYIANVLKCRPDM